MSDATSLPTAEILCFDGADDLDFVAPLEVLAAAGFPVSLVRLHAEGAVLASVCTGAMLLSAAGLLAGRPATTHRVALADLAEAGARVDPDARVVDDGDVVTCGGVSAGLDLAVHLVERFAGARAGRQAAARLEHTPVGPLRVRTPAPATR